MGALIYSAIGTAMARGPQYKLDLEKLEPGMLMSTSRDRAPTRAEAAAEAKTPLAQRIREETLLTMGLKPEDLTKMQPRTRADLEQNLARHIHEQILRSPDAAVGSSLNIRA